jgi:hypothetical protein
MLEGPATGLNFLPCDTYDNREWDPWRHAAFGYEVALVVVAAMSDEGGVRSVYAYLPIEENT